MFACAAACGACATGAGRYFDGSTYREGPIAFVLPPKPTSWHSVSVREASLAYRDDAHAASILINARCRRPDEGTPLLALTNHLLIGSTERDIVSQDTEPFDGREALHTKVRAKWDGVPMSFDLFVSKKDGCLYDFVYIGESATFEAGSRVFEDFVRGFKTLPHSGTVSGGLPEGQRPHQ